MSGAGLILPAAILLTLGLSMAMAQGLPVRIHDGIRTFAGDPNRVVAATQDPPSRITLYSAHKEGGRPWADAIWVRQTPEGRSFLSRAYDCEAGTYRWLGEAARLGQISLSVSSVAQTAPRRLEPGTVEYDLARHACAL
ncbi:hypothetical protein HMH01_15505 [Halovulum dunhuangense]|uniref:Uncharacterized protein n=1 Tax=Halovulum dunhuangense TaxID=1505036 RepID=A0A849L6G7_9RHOB|nr:hypothetical protein [Halovulum dunhuangense]NNU81843.1 hypothetical protein [Halovulum dunhuangense]